MACLTVSSFCCLNLNIGGVIIGYLELIVCGYIFFALRNFSVEYILFGVMLTLIIVGWTYGVRKRDVTSMMPNLVLSSTVSATLSLIPVSVYITSFFDYQLLDDFYIKLFIDWKLYYVFMTVFFWYLTCVKYSLFQLIKYEKMKENQLNRHEMIHNKLLNEILNDKGRVDLEYDTSSEVEVFSL